MVKIASGSVTQSPSPQTEHPSKGTAGQESPVAAGAKVTGLVVADAGSIVLGADVLGN